MSKIADHDYSSSKKPLINSSTEIFKEGLNTLKTKDHFVSSAINFKQSIDPIMNQYIELIMKKEKLKAPKNNSEISELEKVNKELAEASSKFELTVANIKDKGIITK
jgi:hypothetical protein